MSFGLLIGRSVGWPNSFTKDFRFQVSRWSTVKVLHSTRAALRNSSPETESKRVLGIIAQVGWSIVLVKNEYIQVFTYQIFTILCFHCNCREMGLDEKAFKKLYHNGCQNVRVVQKNYRDVHPNCSDNEATTKAGKEKTIRYVLTLMLLTAAVR